MGDLHYDPQIKAKMDTLLLPIPGVTAGSAFGHPAYKIGGKVFLFVGVSGIAIKLPPQRVQILIASSPNMIVFEPAAGIAWKQWLSVERDDVAAYEQDLGLLEESVSYVAQP